MTADAKAHRAELALRHLAVLREIVQRSAPILVEMHNRSPCRILQSTSPACIVEWDHGAERFHAVVDLMRSRNKTVSGHPGPTPQHRPGELNNIRIAENPRLLPVRFRPRHN